MKHADCSGRASIRWSARGRVVAECGLAREVRPAGFGGLLRAARRLRRLVHVRGVAGGRMQPGGPESRRRRARCVAVAAALPSGYGRIRARCGDPWTKRGHAPPVNGFQGVGGPESLVIRLTGL